MREIKFRVWSDKSKSWLKDENVLSFYISNDGELEIDCSDWSKSKLTIQQYTGLKDKNGVEIYEGDIVECYYWFDGLYSRPKKKDRIEVKCWTESSLTPKVGGGPYGFLTGFEVYEDIEIVGNIFEGVDK